MPLCATCALVLCVVLAPQQPVAGAVEVIGPAPRPSDSLRKQVEKGEDEILLFDVCYGVRQVTGDLHRLWGQLESTRAEGMRALLDGMPKRCATQQDAATSACANVAAVAAALLEPSAKRRVLTREQADEVREVEAAGPGTQRFLPVPEASDWKDARPVGGYANDRLGWDGLGELYRATIYLRRYFDTWPEETRTAWRAHTAACRGASVTAKTDLERVESQMPILFGARVDEGGVLHPVVVPDRVWLAARVGEDAVVGDKLAAMFVSLAMPSPKSQSDGVLRLCHELTIAQPNDPLFGAMTPAQWRAKWSDAASFAYVGLREVDCLAGVLARSSTPPAPTLIVEPLSAVWEALRWLDRRRSDPGPGDAWRRERSWIDPVLEALALQQKGQDLPAELNDELREKLLTGFDESDVLIGTTTRIEGVPTRVRRAVPQLVRVPIVWRGETKKALALRLFVEQEGPDGKWQPTPVVR